MTNFGPRLGAIVGLGPLIGAIVGLWISTPSVTASTRSPIDLVWVIRAGPLSLSDTYVNVRTELARLVDLAVEVKARATILVSGDVAEETWAQGHAKEFGRWIAEGFEVGTFVGLKKRVGLRRWIDVSGTGRFGEGGYDHGLTTTLWKQHREWVDRLVGANRNRVVDADTFRCSTEVRLSHDNHFDVSFCRAGQFLYHNDELGSWPWHPAGSDARGAELFTDANARLMALDLTGQVGDPFDRAGDWSVLRLKEAYLRRVDDPSGIRTLPFLTHASPSARSFSFEVERWVRFLAIDTVLGNRRARWSTASSVRSAVRAWEAVSPLPSVRTRSGPEPDPVALRVRNAHLEGVTRLRAGRAFQPTCAANLESRWWGLSIWRAALMSTLRSAIERAEPQEEWTRLEKRMVEGPCPELFAALDALIDTFESVVRSTSKVVRSTSKVAEPASKPQTLRQTR